MCSSLGGRRGVVIVAESVLEHSSSKVYLVLQGMMVSGAMALTMATSSAAQIFMCEGSVDRGGGEVRKLLEL